MVKTTKSCKTRQRRQHERSVAVLIRPSEGQPSAYVRITQDGEPAHYWVDAVPADWGKAFKVAKPGHEGEETYDVLLDGDKDSCTCPGHTYHGYCKHVDGLRALDAAGQLPRPDGYKPDSQHQLPF
jgi:hypothetical protein